VAALALGVDRVERERRLARTRETGEHDQPLARQLELDVLEVVLSRATDADGLAHVITSLAFGVKPEANICSCSGGTAIATMNAGARRSRTCPSRAPALASPVRVRGRRNPARGGAGRAAQPPHCPRRRQP